MRSHALVPKALLLLGSLALTAACAKGSGTPSPSPEPVPAGPSASRTVDPSRIKGLEIVNDSSEQSSCPFAISYPDVPGAEAMTAAMKKDVDRLLASFRSSRCGSGSPAGGELNVSHRFLVASGDVLGVRLTTLDGSGAGNGQSTSTYWYDGEDGAYRQALALIADGSREVFTAALKKQLTGREGVDPAYLDDSFADTTNRADLLDDLSFTADGGLRVQLDSGTVGSSAAGSYVVALDKATITPWLSPFGRHAQKQTEHPSSDLDLGAPHAPRMAMPTHTASADDDTDCKRVKCIALTFDDGPAAPETATLLNHLARHKARVTFFTVGQNVAAHPELVRAEAKAGHEVGNHSWNHPDLTKLSPEQVAYQLGRTTAAIKAATGKAPTLFRPPYGAVNAKVKAATTLSPVLWDVDTEDWKYRDSAKVAQTVIAKARRNSVVLMHDIHPTSVAAVPEILRSLTAQGFHFVTVSHLRATL
ncbi:polysaccharide deacetylase family protein [Streptomyces europaeiscabiei]|uniref:polysaccharide deacetylase family protein n=1 Tax=Streptomyces europaeiscabiei TaxID=146819 RepID=UPI0029BB4928|nr:polysaccharide deacetylase family protein [Streptomyces europaeiscabiei]MDX3714155.1 polysaccharide deacetylase family protein [Streptomyces europaeiscabiei]